MKKVLLLKGHSQYGVMRNWTDQLNVGFEKLGVEVILLDMMYMGNSHLEHYLNLGVDAILSFNGYLLEYNQIKNYIDQLGIPYIFMLADHPVDHIIRIKALKDKDILTLIDRNDFHFLKQLDINTQHVHFLPHAALETPDLCTNKTIDLLFSGTYSDPNTYLADWSETPMINEMVETTIHECLRNPHVDYIQYFFGLVKQKGLSLELDTVLNLHSVYHNIGRYLYSIRRGQIIEEIGKSGLPLHVYGNKWEESGYTRYKNITFHGPIGLWALTQKVAEAKISLNIGGIKYDGTHERIPNAMAYGSVCLTERLPYLEEEFEDQKSVLFYDYNHFPRVLPVIEDVLRNDEKRNEIAALARQIVKEKHTYQIRAGQIKQIFEAIYGAS